MKKLTICLITIAVTSCGGEEKTTGPDDFQPLEDTMDVEYVLAEDDLEDFPEQMPEGYSELVKIFEGDSKEIDESYVEMLGANPEDAYIAPFYTEKMYTVDAGTIFQFATPAVATSLYEFSYIHFAFFNRAGELINTESKNAIAHDIDIQIMLDFIVYIHLTYPEYEEGEFSHEATGNMEEEHLFYICDEELVPLEQVDKEKLPFYRNQIFAKHGYIFKSTKYTDYFSNYDWYKPQFENVDHLLSDDEKNLADRIKFLEEE
jgi:hypothetical protein